MNTLCPACNHAAHPNWTCRETIKWFQPTSGNAMYLGVSVDGPCGCSYVDPTPTLTSVATPAPTVAVEPAVASVEPPVAAVADVVQTGDVTPLDVAQGYMLPQ